MIAQKHPNELRIVPKAKYNFFVSLNVLASRSMFWPLTKEKEACKGLELGRGREALFLIHGYLCTAHITIDVLYPEFEL
jgi:hypothetical protein